MEAALRVYLGRIKDIPFGSSVIKLYTLYRGATDKRATELKEQRQNLLVYLRGGEANQLRLNPKRKSQINIITLNRFGTYGTGTLYQTSQLIMCLLSKPSTKRVPPIQFARMENPPMIRYGSQIIFY